MTAPYQDFAAWEHDHAHLAIVQWITAWRDGNKYALQPPIRFAQHLGREAVAMQNEGMERIEMQRIFAAAGYDGRCICDLKPTDPMPEVIS